MKAVPIALKNWAFRRLLAAQIPADFADWLDFVAIGAILAFTWGVAPTVYALLAVAMALPYLIIGPFAGAMVDRLPIRPVLVGSDLGRGVTTALLFFAPNWQVLIALVALRSALDCFFTPAKQAALQSLTTETDRTSANGLSQAVSEASKVMAPIIGGSLLALISPGSLFLINAVLSFAAALLGLRLGTVPKPARDPGPGLFAEVAVGLTDVWTVPLLRTTIAMFGAGFFAIFLYDTYFAPLLLQMQLTQFHLGMALGAVGCGGLVGSLLFGFAKSLRRPFRLAAAGFLFGGCAAILLGWSGLQSGSVALPTLLAIFATLGFCSAMTFIPLNLILQNNVPPDRIGRVTSLNEAVITLSISTAPFVGAVLVSAGSFATPFIVGGAVTLALAVTAFANRDAA